MSIGRKWGINEKKQNKIKQKNKNKRDGEKRNK